MSRYVDALSTSHGKDEPSIYDCMYYPRPPGAEKPAENGTAEKGTEMLTPEPPKQSRGIDISIAIGEKQNEVDRTAAARLDIKRKAAIERHSRWAQQNEEVGRQNHLMAEQRQQATEKRLRDVHGRRELERQELAGSMDAKAAVNAAYRRVQDERAQTAHERLEGRGAMLQARFQRHEEGCAQRQSEMKDSMAQKQAVHAKGVQDRVRSMKENEMRTADLAQAKEQMRRNAKIQRIEGFHKREENAQRNRTLKYEVSDKCWDMARSQVFP